MIDRALQPPLPELGARLRIEHGDDASVVHHVEHVAVHEGRGQLRHRFVVLPAHIRVGHVAPAAETDGQQAVFARHRRTIVVPLTRGDRAVRIEIDPGTAGAVRHARQLDDAGLGILSRDFVERRNGRVGARLVLGRPEAVDVQRVAADDGRGLELERQAADPPDLLSRGRGISRQQERAGHDHLRRPAGRFEENRRRVAAVRLRPRRLPAGASVTLCHRDDE